MALLSISRISECRSSGAGLLGLSVCLRNSLIDLDHLLHTFSCG